MGNTMPLEGVKVLDFSTYAAAPICSMTLADWGADVIKIEPITGDMFRFFGLIMQCPVQEDDNIQFEMDNRNKRGISLNLKTGEGKKIIHKLLETADVLVTNYRPKALQSLGLDYETVAKDNPRLVYAYLNGYGDVGPDRDKPGFDLSAYFARSGILVEMPEPGSPPLPALAGFGDHPTGTFLAGGICAALVQRERTGKGCKVQTSLFNAALWNLQLNIASANNNAHLSEEEYLKIKAQRKKPRSGLMNTYQSKDCRWITVMALEYNRYWKPFAEIVLMRPDLADDPRFNNQMAGFQHGEELAAIIDEAFGKLTEKEIVTRLKEADIAHEVNLRWKEIKNDVQALENGFIMEYKMPSGRTDWVMGNPVRFNGEKTLIRRNAPRLGEHNDEILSELGYGAEQIAAWRAGMIIK
ncbi:MAG: CaiB/BaiF CoA-transferase family protein [Syntrophales bacterium]|nr:CaiB/BaiF CoA-transferase family protein [Syntrophales bacterium]